MPDPTCPGCGRPLATDAQWDSYKEVEEGQWREFCARVGPVCWALGECEISNERATAYAGLEAAVREAERTMAFIPESHGVLNVVLRPALAALDATAEVSDGTT